jgi:hypothetical protein
MIGGIAGSVLGNATMLYGYYSAKKNKKQLEEIEKNRPVYTAPEEAQQYLELYKNMAGNRELPGQSQYEQNIQQASVSGARNIQNLTESPTSSLGAMTDLYRNEMNAYNNLAVQQQQYYEGNQQKLAGALNQMANYRDMEFEYNVNNPWQRKYQNKINEYVSNRGLMQQGISTWANASSNFGGSQGSSQPMQEPNSQYNPNINYGAMQNSANNSPMMDSSNNVSQYGGYA